MSKGYRKDLTGQRFGRLTVIGFALVPNDKKTYWECKCDCGNICKVAAGKLQSGDVKSCGCLKKELAVGRRKDLSGLRFGRLKVLNYSHTNNKGRAYWTCLCDCGNITTVQTDSLMTGKTKSCGRFGKECPSPTQTHGMTHTRLYHRWNSMRDRCNNPKCKSYKNYGGRGIKVCDEWENSFEAFRDWALANGYDDNLTIDRIDVNGNYEPENCRWTDFYTQSRNRRNNHYIECFGKKQILSDWAKETGIRMDSIRTRIKKGWSIEKALSTPTKKYKK